MIDEQKMRELAEAATPGPWISAGPSFGAEFPVYCNEVVVNRQDDEDDTYGICQAPTCLEQESTHDMDYIAAVDPQTIIALLDELQSLRSERTAWRVTAENAEKYAARYRWIRSMTCAEKDSRGRQQFILPDPHPQSNLMAGSVAQHLDAAIDAAMKETP